MSIAISPTGSASRLDGHRLTIRPIAPFDRVGLARFVAELTPESRYRRFLAPKPRLTSTELTYLTQLDHRTHAALVAVEPFGRRIVGVARYAAAPGVPETADLAVVIADAWQGQGLGRVLVERLLETARGGPVRTLTATVLAENAPARALLAAVGFRAVAAAGATVELERPVGPVADLPVAA